MRARRPRAETASRSTANWRSIQKRRGGNAPGESPAAARLAAPLLHELAGARDVGGALVVVDEEALALGVGARDALAALEHGELLAGAGAVLALCLLLFRA